MAARPSTDAGDAGEAVTSELDEALTLAPQGEPGAYDAELGAGWLIGNAVNGGLLMALAGRALSVELARAGSHPDPFAVERLLPVRLDAGARDPAHRGAPHRPLGLHRAGGPDPAGRRRHRGGAGPGARDVRRPGHGRARGAHHRRTAGPATAGALPAGGDAPPTFLRHAAMLDRLDLRLDPATAGWAAGRPSGWGRSAAGCGWPTAASPTR